AGDERRRQVPPVDLQPRRARRPGGLHDGLLRRHAGSSTLCTRFTSGRVSSCTLPDGQRTVTLSGVAPTPRPKCSRRWFCEQKPEPPATSCTCCWPFQLTVTCAPIALRFVQPVAPSDLQPPSSSKPIQLRSAATWLRYSSSGPRWLATTRSSMPWFPRSASATERPSYRSVAPTSCDTSRKRPAPSLSHSFFC